MTHLIDNIVAVEVPEGSFNHFIKNDQNGNPRLIYHLASVESKPLPPGNWQLLFLSNEVTEEEARGIVLNFKPRGFSSGAPREYKNYLSKPDDYTGWFKSAIESFHSLLKSKNLTGNFAILKQTS